MTVPPSSKLYAGRPRFVSWLVCTVFLGLIIGQIFWPSFTSAASGNIVISQVYGGGGNSGATLKNDFIELYNLGPAPVDLSTWSVQYAASGSAFSGKTPLVGTIAPGHYYLIQEAAGSGGAVSLPTPDATGSIAMSATGAKVALVSNQISLTCGAVAGNCLPNPAIVDFVGYDGANNFEGSGPAPALINTTAAIRKSGGCTDTDNNLTDFVIGSPSPRNSASAAFFCGGPTNPTGSGLATPASVLAGATTLLTVTVVPGTNPPSTGITVVANLSAIGGQVIQTFSDDGTNGDVAPGDNIFSFQAIVGSGIVPGLKNMAVVISDAQGRSGSANIPLTIEPPVIAIHDIQGSGNVSPHVGELVATTGIVTGVKNNGFFIQTPDAEVDSDPNTSEGVFVFTSSAPPAAAAVGNSVKVTGTVQEFIPSADPFSPPMTELAGSPAVTLLSTGNALPTPITLTAADTDPAGTLEQLERFEGMRVHVDSLTVVGPTLGSVNEANATGTSNGVFYVVITGVARPFREPGIQVPDPLPAGSPCCIPRFDANPELLQVDGDGQIGGTKIEVTSGAVVANVTGPLDFSFRTYMILPDPGTAPVVAGIHNAIPVPLVCPAEFTVASFNMQRFFDTVSDPTVSDVVLTATAFNNRLNKASLAIRGVLGTPDILGVEELENLPTLQALAAKINNDAVTAGDPNPNYQPFLVEGNDIGGIDVGFLVKGSRVNVIDVTQEGKDATYISPLSGLPELLNDRPPLVLHSAIQPPVGTPYPLTVIVNHLRSLIGVDDPADGPRVRAKRAAQAEFLANLIQLSQTANPNEHILSVGDYNAFQFNDGFVDVMGTIKGTPAPSDQVALGTNPLVSPVLIELGDLVPADQRYSYVESGNAQVLDHILATGNLMSRFDGLFYARNDADFPESFRSDPNRPERISDHDAPVAYFRLPLVITGASLDKTSLWPPNHKMVNVTVNYGVANNCDPATTASLSVSSNEPINGTGDGDTTPDWIVLDNHHVQLRAERAGTGNGRLYTITITVTDSQGNTTTQSLPVTVPLNQH
ncbi:MAG: lamin tail domain-containing protein [Terriglobia bacterium]